MQNIGIIAEFNPFHSGHKYLIDSLKHDNNAITVVMSGNFVQRGDTAILPKSIRAQMALKNGADLVLDLPTPFAMSTAQDFAFGAISILKNLGNIDAICFGSECGDIDALQRTADILQSEEFNLKLADAVSSGETFAKVRSRIMKDYGKIYSDILSNPNDTLGCEYISAAKIQGFNPDFQCIRRIGAEHNAKTVDITASATLIREYILSGDIHFAKQFMDKQSFNLIEENNISNINSIEKAILTVLRIKVQNNELINIADLSEGIENRLKTAIIKARSLSELYDLVKTKRYTLARVRRLVLSAFLGIDNSYHLKDVPYINVLGFTDKGEKILKDASQKCPIPLILRTADANRLEGFAEKVWNTECKATDIYSLSLKSPQGCGQEYYKKIIKE